MKQGESVHQARRTASAGSSRWRASWRAAVELTTGRLRGVEGGGSECSLALRVTLSNGQLNFLTGKPSRDTRRSQSRRKR
eukprot:3923442-Rhodomonas_salina.3